uniref:Si:ch1073-349o24.2 n=1 Tax=Nothobranchius furzeri TaxID=105023 RepID=A0A8C6PTV1_NOTFU
LNDLDKYPKHPLIMTRTHNGQDGRYQKNTSNQKTCHLGLETKPELLWDNWSPGSKFTKVLVLKNIDNKLKKLNIRHPMSNIFSASIPQIVFISPGTTFIIPITFGPQQMCEYEDSIEFQDKKERFCVYLHAIIPCHMLEVPGSVELPLCAVQHTSQTEFHIKNARNFQTFFEWDCAEPFHLSPERGLLQPEQECPIRVMFHPQEAQMHQQQACCRFGDEGEKANSVTVHLQGEGAAEKELERSMKLSNLHVHFSLSPLPAVAMFTSAFYCDVTRGILPPGGSLRASVTYSPTVVDTVSVEYLSLKYNGSINNPQLTLKGKCIGPSVSLLPLVLDFGCVKERGSAVLTVKLINSSPAEAIYQWDIDSGNSVFSILPASGSVAPHSHIKLKAVYRPTQPIAYYRRVACLVLHTDPVFLDLIGTCHSELQRPQKLKPEHLVQYMSHYSYVQTSPFSDNDLQQNVNTQLDQQGVPLPMPEVTTCPNCITDLINGVDLFVPFLMMQDISDGLRPPLCFTVRVIGHSFQQGKKHFDPSCSLNPSQVFPGLGGMSCQNVLLQNNSTLPLTFCLSHASNTWRDSLSLLPGCGLIPPGDHQIITIRLLPTEDSPEQGLLEFSFVVVDLLDVALHHSLLIVLHDRFEWNIPETEQRFIFVKPDAGELHPNETSVRESETSATVHSCGKLFYRSVKNTLVTGSGVDLQSFGRGILHASTYPQLLARTTSSSPQKLCEVQAKGVFPTLQVVGACSGGSVDRLSKGHVWKLLSLDSLNEHLRSAPSSAEVTTKPPINLHISPPIFPTVLLDFSFGSASVYSDPAEFVLMFHNPGSFPVDWAFLFPKDQRTELPGWAETGELSSTELDHMQIQDCKLFTVAPHSGTLLPGQKRAVQFSYSHNVIGTNRLPVVFKLSYGRETLLNFQGVTVEQDKPHLFASNQHAFAPVDVGDCRPPRQMYELYNGGAVQVHYEVDQTVLSQLQMDNFNHPVLSCISPQGEVLPGETATLEWIFSPLELKLYQMDVPIHIHDNDLITVRFEGCGTKTLTQSSSDVSMQREPFPGQVLFLSEDSVLIGDVPVRSQTTRVFFLTNVSHTESALFLWEIPRQKGSDQKVCFMSRICLDSELRVLLLHRLTKSVFARVVTGAGSEIYRREETVSFYTNQTRAERRLRREAAKIWRCPQPPRPALLHLRVAAHSFELQDYLKLCPDEYHTCFR